ncbi:unnamed protein product [Polarella glacialis]|uniref:Uncharacterized protein n=1 Tax=Polarella glacialis TaxID=89957 RepID=A0A813IP77_POLGL|nr:unnamed protein product [Polarella glacialis]
MASGSSTFGLDTLLAGANETLTLATLRVAAKSCICEQRSNKLVAMEQMLQLGGVPGRNIYDMLLGLAQVHFGLEGPISQMAPTLPAWTALLTELKSEMPTMSRHCAPAAALLSLLVAEVPLTAVLYQGGTCASLVTAVSDSAEWADAKQQYVGRDGPARLAVKAAVTAGSALAQRSRPSQAAQRQASLHRWLEVLSAGQAYIEDALVSIDQWERRCKSMVLLQPSLPAGSIPVIWACKRPFVGKEMEVEGRGNAQLHACINGISSYARFSSSSFWHFARGYLFEVFAALVQRFGSRKLGFVNIALGDLTYPCDVRHDFVEFFQSFSNGPPTVDPGCSMSRLLGHPVLGVRSSPGHQVAAASACALRSVLHSVTLRHVYRNQPKELRRQIQGRHDTLLLISRKQTDLSHREPFNAAAARAAAAKLCVKARLACLLGVYLEDWSWRQQLSTFLGSKALVGSHGSGLGAAALWLPPGAAVLELAPPSCWWCEFAMSVTRPNCSLRSTRHLRPGPKAWRQDGRLTWILSTTADTPPAVLADQGEDPAATNFGCASATAADVVSVFERRREERRSVGLRAFRALEAVLSCRSPTARAPTCGAVALRRWARAEQLTGRPKVLLDACAGSAVQVYEASQASHFLGQ